MDGSSMERAWLRRAAERATSAGSISCCASALRDAAGVPRHARPVGLSVRDHPEGLLSAAGHRPDHRASPRRAQDISFAEHDAPAGGPRRGRREGSRRRPCRDVDRRQRQPAQHRPHVHHAEAARPARRHRRPGHRPAAPRTRKVAGRAALPAGRPGRPGRRPRVAHAVPVHAAGSRLDELNQWAPDARQDARPCRSCATSPPISRPTARR